MVTDSSLYMLLLHILQEPNLAYLIPDGDCKYDNEENEYWPGHLSHENDDAKKLNKCKYQPSQSVWNICVNSALVC